MKFHHRVLGGMTSASLLAALMLAACSNVDTPNDEASVATAEDPIIAGVDAKSSTLNAVGSLVEIYRSRYTNCGYGGRTGMGGAPTTTTVIPSPIPVPIGATDPMHGRLDRIMPDWALAGRAGAPTTAGGAPAAGGAPPIGRGGTTSVGGVPVTAGAAGTAGCTTVETVRYWPFCTATLIGPTAVQSAKHCLMDLDYMTGIDVGFAVGPTATSPAAVYPIVDWEWESEVAGDSYSLLSDLGSDVGVAHLSGPVVGVVPMAIGSLSEADRGKRFTALGYGVQDNNERNGTRKAGSVTLRGLGGNYADYAFGGLEGFLKAAKSMPDFQGYPEYYLTDIYYRLNLLPEYQAFLGGIAGDAQPCFGDSGGPMVAMQNGVRTVFGNVTSGFASSRLICDYGAVFAVFGPSTQTFLQNALLWVDPCAGVSVNGYCAGDLAIRCTNRQEGKRRLSETDCGLLGQTCGLDSTGTVACVDPS